MAYRALVIRRIYVEYRALSPSYTDTSHRIWLATTMGGDLRF